MSFIGIDLHTNKCTCCYRDGQPSVEHPAKGRTIKTFALDARGLAAFFQTLARDTYVLAEATITAFSFVRLFKDRAREVCIANAYELKQAILARRSADKTGADKRCRILKARILSGERLAAPVALPPEQIQDLRGLFSTYRLYRKQRVQLKNRVHSPLKERLRGFTQEEIFSKRNRQKIRAISPGTAMRFQASQLLGRLEREEADADGLKERTLRDAAPYTAQIEILTSMKGVSVFIAIAIIADIIDAGRFRNSKAFASYVRSAPQVSNSNTSVSAKGTNKQGRKLSAALLAQSLNHMLNSSFKLRRWHGRLCEYQKPGLVRTGLRRRVLAEIFQMLKKGEYHYGRDAKNHEAQMLQYRRFLERQKNNENVIQTA